MDEDDTSKPPPDYGFEGDDLRTVVARTLYGHEVERAREHTASLELQPDRLRRVFTLAMKESDRSLAILLFALAEDIMIEAVKRYLEPAVKGGWDEVTGGNGLLATANDRLSLLALLRWVRPAIYADLRLMKSIRNRFAHHAEVAGFEDQTVRSWIGGMAPTEGPILATALEKAGGAGPPFSNLTARQLYLMRSGIVITKLISDLAIAPQARASGVAPGHVAGRDWDEYPENLKVFHRIAADLVLAVVREVTLAMLNAHDPFREREAPQPE